MNVDDNATQIEKLKLFILQNLTEINQDNKDFCVKSLIRNSVLEKIITRFMFQYKVSNTEYSLTQILNYIKEVTENTEISEETGKRVKVFLDEIFKQTKNDRQQQGKQYPLSIYSKIVTSILTFPKQHQQNNDYGLENCVKIEKLLQEHIDVNFFSLRTEGKKIDNDFFNEQYVKCVNERTDHNYSVTSFFTLLGIMKKLEQHNVQVNDNEIFQEDGLMTEKKLQIFERQLKKTTFSFNKIVNVVEYFIQNGHVKKLLNQLYSPESIYNNYEIEQKLCLSLFLIKKLIQDYSFYFSKQELENILIEVKKFKDFPIPIGSLGMELFEILVNELYFQGITVINKLRNLYLIDSLDTTVTSLLPKHFNPVFVVYYEDESIKQDVTRILGYTIERLNFNNNAQYQRTSLKEELVPREFLVKIFLTIVRNSTFPVNNSILEYIIKKFMSQKKGDYGAKNLEDADTSMQEDKSKKQDNTYTSIKKLLRILDIGLDKNHEEFMEDIHYISEPLVGLNESYMMGGSKVTTHPITEFRDYLVPVLEYSNKVVVEIEYNVNSGGMFNLYTTFLSSFTLLYNNYFIYLDDEENDSNEVLQSKQKKRENIFKQFNLKLMLFEDKKVLNHVLDQLATIEKSIDTIENSKDWAFWKKFISKKSDFDVRTLLYIVPNIDNIEEVFPKVADKCRPYLSEYIASNDHVYYTMVFYPWLCKKDFCNMQLVEKLSEFCSEKYDFKCADEADLHSMFLDPLYLYTTDADKVLNVYLYKVVSMTNNFSDKYFWRCVEIDFFPPRQGDSTEKKKKIEYSYNITAEITLYCVDALGLEFKDNKVTIKITNPVELKIYNIFSKKESPMHYNNTSNNTWLEVYLIGKLTIKNLFYF